MLRALVPAVFLLSVAALSQADVTVSDGQVRVSAGILRRIIKLDGTQLTTQSLRVDGHEILEGPGGELSVTFTRAEPNQRPVGLKPGQGSVVEQTASTAGDTDTLDVKTQGPDNAQSLRWLDPVTVKSGSWAGIFDVVTHSVTTPKPGVTQLVLHVRSSRHPMLRSVSVDIYYQIYDGIPAIRKWAEITNKGSNWLKIQNLVLDDIALSQDYCNRTLLTPEERGAGSSVIGFGNQDSSCGIIAVSEIPSALRVIGPDGRMGYSGEHFEWVLGPDEQFVSEPVFQYAFSGTTHKTISGVSTALDRTIEGPFMRFLEQRIGIAADPGKLPVPLWCSWSNFGPAVNDSIMREQADIAAKCGFVGFQMDAGWARDGGSPAWDSTGTEPDAAKFPDFEATSRYIRARGLKLGLWVSDFRTPGSDDLTALPNAASLPEIRRGGGLGMSFAGPWRTYYARDLVSLHNRFGMDYVKQDLSNIRFGDIAEGHDSRTKKESLLRGLRGLLEAQDIIRRRSDVTPEITHEIYWGTPGVPADVAALKHAMTYHIPPNDYAGCGNAKQRPNEKWTYDPKALHDQLIQGCFSARQRFYAHRGLPLYGIEYYGAATVNFRGSLTPEIQDRQVCSWLMGVPSLFAGDLASLTSENIARYRARFDLIKRLQKDYGIYRYFQCSGVPAPTDTDWHWWGKLNPKGFGAVVVVQGKEGSGKRAINIPWVVPTTKYRVQASFAGKDLGTFTGRQLQDGKLVLPLPVYGQEILELAPVGK